MQTVLQLPTRGETGRPAARLAEILAESAQLLDTSRDSEDPEVREAAIQLAIRSLKAASLALTPEGPRPLRGPRARVIQGPWKAQSRSS